MITRNRLLQVFLLGAIAGFLLLTSCSGKSNKHKMDEWSQQLDSFSVERAENVSMNYTDSGRLKAIIDAPLMEHYNKEEEPYTEMKKGVKARFYDVEGREESNLSADYAINYEKKKLIHLKKNVHVINSIKEELMGEELFWDQNKREIYTDKQVTIKRGEEVIIGRHGLRSNETFTRYRIKSPEGTVNLPEQKDSTEN